jgi:dUTP pyrophosphatase
MSMDIEVRILDPRLHQWGLPTYQTDLAAGIDLHACLDEPLELRPQAPAVLISSGLAVLMGRADIAALILPRSGLGHKKGLVLGNGVGCVDADYTAPCYISAWCRNPPGSEPIIIQPGDRIAQMLFVPIVRPAFVYVDAFSRETARGAGGFGSTGIAAANGHEEGGRR